MLGDRFMECFAALDARRYVANDVAKALLAFGVALVVECGQGLDEGNAGLDHGGKLPSEKDEVGFFDAPGFLALLGGGRLLLERQDHQPPTHQAGYGVILVEGVLDPGNDLPGHIAGLVGEGDHVMVILMNIAATVPAPLSPRVPKRFLRRSFLPSIIRSQCLSLPKSNRFPPGFSSGGFMTLR